MKKISVETAIMMIVSFFVITEAAMAKEAQNFIKLPVMIRGYFSNLPLKISNFSISNTLCYTKP